MNKHALWSLILVSAVASAGSKPVVAGKAGPLTASAAQTAATQSDAGVAPQAPLSFTELPGAYDAAIGKGAKPDANSNVEISLNGVSFTIDSKDTVISR